VERDGAAAVTGRGARPRPPNHDTEWGVPLRKTGACSRCSFSRARRPGCPGDHPQQAARYRAAFDRFDARRIARYDARKIRRLLADPGIVRNRLKVAAAVTNARAFLAVQKEHGSFAAYIWQFVGGRRAGTPGARRASARAHAESDAMSRDLRARGFTFVGSTICYAFMQATGMVNDHLVTCFRYRQIR
jgi:DNA-3-methyladenine glycosylase I